MLKQLCGTQCLIAWATICRGEGGTALLGSFSLLQLSLLPLTSFSFSIVSFSPFSSPSLNSLSLSSHSFSATEDVFNIENEIFGKNSSVFCVSAQIPIMKYSYLIITAVLAMTLNSFQLGLFLDVSTHLYKPVCPSVCPSVRHA